MRKTKQSIAYFAILLSVISGWLLAQNGPKQPIHGLVTMGSLRFFAMGGNPEHPTAEANVHPGVFAGAVLNVAWDQIEPSPTHYDLSFIESGLADIRLYNQRHPQTPMVAKLRVSSGLRAPGWAKLLDGEPVTVHRTHPDSEQTVGRFWTHGYRAAWKRLQEALAAQYDREPLIAEVAIGSGSSISDEPFILPIDLPSANNLRAAGGADALRKRCLQDAVDDYEAWKLTPLSFTFNVFYNLDSGHPVTDPEFTAQVMQDFRRRLGTRAVIGHHGLNSESAMKPNGRVVEEEMRKLGPPMYFQTYEPNLDWEGAVTRGLSLGAGELEIWESKDAGGFAPLSQAQLDAWSQRMHGHPQ